MGVPVHSEDLARYKENWALAVLEGRPLEVDCRLKRISDETFRWQTIRGLPLHRPDGQVSHWFVTCTEQAQLQGKLRANEAKFQTLIEAAPDAFIISDEAGKIRLVNSQTERLFGYLRRDLMDKPAELLLSERFRQEHMIRRQQCLDSPEILSGQTSFELCGLRADGTEFPIEMTLSAVRTDEGLQVSSAVRDISERKRAESVLERTAAELTRSKTELEQLAYAASHDLQEPLRTIVGATQLLARDYKDKLDAEANQWMTFAAEGAKRMQTLLNALLDYTRLGLPLRPFGLVDCHTTYQAAVANLRAAIEESGADLTSGPLPIVMGDGVQLIQLFQNLLGNAIKFRGEVRPRIHVSAERQDKQWRIKVLDNGIGIDPKNFGRLFVLFQRVHPVDKYPGTGIGLAICRKIVERHGGRIGVESTPGGGSTFYFSLAMVDPQSLPASFSMQGEGDTPGSVENQI